jgi:hypothetical protein
MLALFMTAARGSIALGFILIFGLVVSANFAKKLLAYN